jgi:hypothetical protein
MFADFFFLYTQHMYQETGTLMLTILVNVHGSVIPISTTNKSIFAKFENLRIFSESGDFCAIEMSKAREQAAFMRSIETFRRDFPTGSALPVLESYAESHQLRGHNRRIHHDITYDKIFIADPPSVWGSLFTSSTNGIFLVSVHKKEHAKSDRWVLQQEIPVVNLLNLSELHMFAKLMDPSSDHVRKLRELSMPLESYTERRDAIMKLELAHQSSLLQQLDANFKEEIADWKLTIQADRIIAIKMSFLLEVLQDTTVSTDVKYNLLDYSCSELSEISKGIREPLTLKSKFFGGTSKMKKMKKLNKMKKIKKTRKNNKSK